jgi:hypothetical protein
VILYHFTTISYLRPDMTPGEVEVGDLPPLDRGEVLLPSGTTTNAVWLTTDSEPGADGRSNCVRIKLKLASTDRRLIHYRKWAERSFGADRFCTVTENAARSNPHVSFSVKEWRRRVEGWWLYFAPIPPDRFTDVDVLDGKRPWWLVDD